MFDCLVFVMQQVTHHDSLLCVCKMSIEVPSTSIDLLTFVCFSFVMQQLEQREEHPVSSSHPCVCVCVASGFFNK